MKSGFYKFVILFVTGIIVYSCEHTTEAGKKDPQFKVTFADVSCTEAWLDVSFSDSTQRNLELKFTETGRTVTRTLSAGATMYIDSLQPNTTYNLTATLPETNDYTAKTENLTFTTLDTTSHDFTWEKFTFGEVGTSILYDVAIIDENNIWAVGEIYLRDSTGQADPDAYNAVHWDGSKWELKKIPYIYENKTYWGAIYSIAAFGRNDIWFGIANMIHWDGNKYEAIDIPNDEFFAYINKIWGISSKYLYIVGNNGNIAQYNGYRWAKLESKTDLGIFDIKGVYNPSNQLWEIIAVASDEGNGNDIEVLKISGLQTEVIKSENIPYRLRSLWFIPGRKYYVVGDGIYTKNKLAEDSWIFRTHYPTRYSTTAITGTGFNHIFLAGAFGELMHFNGVDWKSYRVCCTGIDGSFNEVVTKNNITVAVGIEERKGVIFISKN